MVRAAAAVPHVADGAVHIDGLPAKLRNLHVDAIAFVPHAP